MRKKLFRTNFLGTQSQSNIPSLGTDCVSILKCQLEHEREGQEGATASSRMLYVQSLIAPYCRVGGESTYYRLSAQVTAIPLLPYPCVLSYFTV